MLPYESRTIGGGELSEATSLQGEHLQIERLATMLGRIVMRPLPPPPTEFNAIRHAFTNGLKRHLRNEDAIVYPRLLQSGNARVRTIAGRLLAESGELSERFDAYCARWTGATIAADWPGFRFATSELLGMLDRRIAAAAFELYPLLAAEGGEARDGAAQWCGVAERPRMRLRLVSAPTGRAA
jgi:hypothetical protein